MIKLIMDTNDTSQTEYFDTYKDALTFFKRYFADVEVDDAEDIMDLNDALDVDYDGDWHPYFEACPWYAVQRDRDDDWSYGSFDFDEAVVMANKLIDNDEDLREAIIAEIDEDSKTCEDEWIVREGDSRAWHE